MVGGVFPKLHRCWHRGRSPATSASLHRLRRALSTTTDRDKRSAARGFRGYSGLPTAGPADTRRRLPSPAHVGSIEFRWPCGGTRSHRATPARPRRRRVPGMRDTSLALPLWVSGTGSTSTGCRTAKASSRGKQFAERKGVRLAGRDLDDARQGVQAECVPLPRLPSSWARSWSAELRRPLPGRMTTS
jgi:hypothetical protein